MKILCYSTYFSSHLGGVENICRDLCLCFSAKGNSVIWVASSIEDQLNESIDGGVKTIELSVNNTLERNFGVPYPICSIPSLFKVFTQVKNVDIVHIHSSVDMAAVVIYLACKLYKKPLVVTQHILEVPYTNFIFRILQKLAFRFISKTLLKYSSAVTCYSEQVKKYLESEFSKNIRLEFIHNGVNARIFTRRTENTVLENRKKLQLSNSKPVAIFVGRFVEKKGLPLLKKIIPKFPNISWYLIGEGPINPESWNYSNLTVVGRLSQSDIVPWYHSADFMVLPSISEGVPLVLQEGMVCGCPIVASNAAVVGMPSIEPYIHVFGDTKFTFEDAVLEVLSGKVKTFPIDLMKTKLFSTWNWENSGDRFLDLFSNILESRKEEVATR